MVNKCKNLHTIMHAHYFTDIVVRSVGVNSGTVAGSVIGTLGVLVLVAIVIVVLFVVTSRKTYKKKQLEKIQLDILAL